MAVWLSMSMSYVGPGGSTNTSRVAVGVDVHWDSVSYNSSSPPVSVTIDGVTDSANVSFNTGKTGSGSQNIYSKYWDIAHDSSGSARTVYASASYTTGTASGTISTSASLPLAAIGGGDTGGDSGGDSGGNSGGDSSGDSGVVILVHPDTNCTYLGTAHYDVFYAYGDSKMSQHELTTYRFYVKFSTPSNLLSSNCVTVRLTNYKVDPRYNGADCDLTFRLFEGTASNTIDPMTSVSGLPSDLGNIYSSYDVVIPTTELKPNTEYVVEMASSTQSLVYIDIPIGIIIDYNVRGGVHIKTDGTETKYWAYVKNGNNWDLYEPFVKNGNNWDVCGSKPAL